MLRAELQIELKKRFSRVTSKRGSLVLALQGEAGGGKTWLAQRLLAELPCRHLTLPATISSAELARRLPRPEDLPIWVDQLLGRLVQGEATEATAIANALSALLVSSAPFVLQLEDWHETLQSSADLWLALAAALRRTRGVGVLITSRTTLPTSLEVLKVKALSESETLTLLETKAQGTLPPEAQAWIYQRTQGNPLFTLEYFRFLSKRGFLWSDGRHWHWRAPEVEVTPTSVEALIARTLQLAAPSPDVRAALGAKALLPIGSPDRLWAGVSELGDDVLQSVKTHLTRQGLLLAGEFAHPLVREVARRELTQETRRNLAHRAVRLLEREQPDLAADFVEQADLGRSYTYELLLRAVAEARGRKKGQLATLLARAATYSSGPEQIELALEASVLLRHTDVPEAARLAKLVLASAPDHVEATLLRAQLLAQLGSREAEGLLSGLSEDVQRQPSWVRTLIEVRVNTHDYAGALSLWNERPETQATADLETRAQVGRALIQLGRFAEAETLLESALDVGYSETLDHALLQSTRALLPLIQGDFGAAVRRYDLALATLGEASKKHLEPELVQTRRGEVLWMRSLALYRWGRYPEAIADLEVYLKLVSEQGNGFRYAEGQVNLGTYMIEAAAFERAEEVLLESRGVLERNDNVRWLVVVEQQLVQLYLDWAPLHGGALALKHAQAAEGYARRSQSPPHLAEALCFISRAEAVHGQPQRALQLIDELQHLAATLGETRLEVYSGWVRGLALEKLGQEQAALLELEHAVDEMTSLGHKIFAHRLALEIDRIRGDQQTAATRVQHFERIGDLNWVSITHRYFPQLVAAPTQVVSTLRLNVLGPLQLTKDGSPLTYSSGQGKVLLALLLEARLTGRGSVGQLELLDTLYLDLHETHAASALKQLVYRLRSALGTAAIARTSSGYALGAVSSDAEAFLGSGDTSLWRGPYLVDLGEDWASSARDALYHALRRRATEHLRTEPDEAARLGQLLLEADTYDAEALTICLRALAAVGNLRGLEQLYRRSRDHFAEVGERLPNAWGAFLKQYEEPRTYSFKA